MEALSGESGVRQMFRNAFLPIPLAVLLALSACGSSSHNNQAAAAPSPPAATPTQTVQNAAATATPIKHLVVVFGENRSFDHYFGTYPNAQNPVGEPAFTAAANTPAVQGLTPALLAANPNTASGNGANAKNPFRIDRSQANTNGQSHAYTAEQQAYDNGAANLFPEFTGNNGAGSSGTFGTPGLVMGYFDGNTVTALWNYAQNFSMNDNAYTDTFGPSTPGALAVVSGQINGAIPSTGAAVVGTILPDGAGGFTMIGDADPTGDVCSSGSTGQMTANNKNIGDLLNAKGLTWGGFMGGFDLTAVNSNGTTGCLRSTFSSVLGKATPDYIQHHNWFQYYPSTANLAHTRPTSSATVGSTDPLDSTATPVHHEYDVNDFFAAVSAGNYPSVSYLKAPAVGDGHPGNSDPIDEQAFVTKVVNFLQQQPDWKNTAVIITYDDSDGWYDHRYAAPTTSSFDSASQADTKTPPTLGADQLNGPGDCNATGAVQGVGVNGNAVNGRCGPGTRVPFLVISPYAKVNFVDDTPISQASIVRFIEDNWLGGQRIGNGSNDAKAGSIMNMFDFTNGGKTPTLFLDTNQGTKLSAAPQS
jgi:phospholipase C